MTIQRSAPPSTGHPELADLGGTIVTTTASKALAVLRVTTGLVFLWAFLDKTFGLSYSTPSAKAWVNGGSPTKGFLGSVEVGPFQSWFHSIAGDAWTNWLFMLGMLGVGLALVLGIGLRVAAVSGALIMTLMWLAEFPLAQHTSAGEPSGSTNPITDYHVVYAVVLVVLALTYAGNTWGLGRIWSKLPIVRKNRWLL